MLEVIIIFALFLIMGMPVAFAIGISGFFFFMQEPALPYTMPVQLVLSETQSFTLLAIPMFMLAGNLLNNTGITSRLLDLASVLAGHLYGTLAQVTVVLSTLMGGVSGSAIADSSMQARILGPDMTKKGYEKGYSAAIIGFSALICIAVPPGIGLVLYGNIGEISIGRLFTGGIVPGLMMMAFLMIAVTITSRKKGYAPEREEMASIDEIIPTFIKSIWALLFPVILIVGLRFGLMTPSEAGSFAAVYAIVIGVLIYKELSWQRFVNSVKDTIGDVGMIIFLISLSSLFSYGIVWDRIPVILTSFLLNISDSPQVIFLIILTFLFFLGMFIDSTVIILLLTSILVPVITRIGIDPVHFGVVMVIICAMGLLTPPVGVAMYSVCSVMECSVGEYMKESYPFLLALFSVIILLVFFPQLVIFLPNLIFN
ncbi:tripartite ATP-independent transporter DctM subunit [Halanaerobium saccharolyticum]|uniref:Tripartite ATP-independent transporter DctM subunit n=1 Tax=Halanaerobium saccharolyticum TaxID=43595 RepID=A0A4R7Z5D9_9FIRM|nr:TRAP transporter large permease subunit [Halanaerobium saccharolyticum]RAK12488.1 tripartite ATP-independent transporter DctM subunit [Halanaerobium saccharolyticum]TDW06414.1 tripartite ATP-independent transporter DctM subunit [Halanaerobium saccharolyticum]TDX61662.1 tripartite ATP-independent transporter DctM subunit [Halanaerobium saccharolyticum]